MTFKTWSRVGLPTLLAAAALALPVLAQTATPAADAAAAVAAAPTINKGDTAWMLVSAMVVLMMSVPGLALFYGGLVRGKNMLSVLMQVFYTVCIVGLIWVLYGYSMAFTGGSDFVGGFSKAFMKGIT
ncbi:MAG: ammonia channel protein, partial [Rhizobiales bacterium 35-66-30]